MKLVTYIHKDSVFQSGEAGVILGDRVLNVLSLETEYANATGKFGAMSSSVLALFQQPSTQVQGQTTARQPKLTPVETLNDALGWFVNSTEGNNVKTVPLSEVELLAPIPNPSSMRDGYAFRQHVEAARRNRGVEMIPEFDLFPVFYFTNHQAVIGPGLIEVMPEHLKKLDYELEAAIVISKAGKNIKAGEADEYIGGYMVMNDWSARYLQMEEMKLNLGPAKGKDFATAIGPWLVTRDELASRRIPGEQGERYDLAMTATINGKEYSRGNLKDMNWTFAQIIERASYGVMLYPGDVIGSGTVGTGCLLELNGSKITDNIWVNVGDVVTCSIEMLGDLTNTVVAAST